MTRGIRAFVAAAVAAGLWGHGLAQTAPPPVAPAAADVTAVTGDGDADGVSWRVIGGIAVDSADKWPSMVALRLAQKSGEKRFWCGATVIDREWLLTAAHCLRPQLGDGHVLELSPRAFVALAGTNRLDAGGREIAVVDGIVHPGFDRARMINDIALLRLARPVDAPRQKLGGRATAAQFLQAETPVTVTGYGLTERPDAVGAVATATGQPSPVLREADLKLVSTATCARDYAGYGVAIGTGATVCAAVDDATRDSCKGDSGGPLLAREATGGAVQIGIVSYGAGCGRAGIAGVYASVAHFEDWIRSHVPNASFATAAGGEQTSVIASEDEALQQLLGALGATAPSRSGQLTVDVAPGERVAVGRPITVRLWSSVEGALIVYVRDDKGALTQLFPNTRSSGEMAGQSPRSIGPGQSISIPNSGYDRFQLPASGPPGVLEIIAIVLGPDIATADLTRANVGFRALADPVGVLDALAVRTRDLAIVDTRKAVRAIGRRRFEVVAQGATPSSR